MQDPALLPRGFRSAGVHGGIKRDADKFDVALIVSDRPAAAAGVFTQNRVAAAPVRVSRERVPGGAMRAIVANSGNANACTGDAGLCDARRMAALVADRIGCPESAVLVASTGVIGERLPMDRIEPAIGRAFDRLGDGSEALLAAARGIMTTDTRPKIAMRNAELAGRGVRLTGIAKGAAMIAPNMATMLSFLVTDAALPPATLQRLLADAVDRSFNRISVEGHTSTNDTVLALANGAGEPLTGDSIDSFARLIEQVCTELAQAIVRDGEGAQHFVTIDVEGLPTVADARQVARCIANSALVKTAICGADPNWGRFVSAAGYSGVAFDEREVSVWLNGELLYERGTPVEFDSAAASQRLRDNRDVQIRIAFERGTSRCQFWTCDLTEEYVRLNADYRT